MVSTEYEGPDERSRPYNPYKRLPVSGLESHSADIGLQGRSKAKINAGRWSRRRRRRREALRKAPSENKPTASPAASRTNGSMHPMSPLAIVLFIAAILDLSSALPPMTTMQVVPILQRKEVRNTDGEFSLKYVTGDGIVLAEVGRLKSTEDGKDAVLVKEGSYSYTSPEGQVVKLAYVADERGFRPVTGDIHPGPPVEKQ